MRFPFFPLPSFLWVFRSCKKTVTQTKKTKEDGERDDVLLAGREFLCRFGSRYNLLRTYQESHSILIRASRWKIGNLSTRTGTEDTASIFPVIRLSHTLAVDMLCSFS